MSSKSTWGLVVAASVLFALIYFVEHPLREARQRQISRQVLPGLDPATVTSVMVHPANQFEIRAELQSNSWRLVKPITYPAANQQIQDFLIYLSNLEWQKRILAEDLKESTNAMAEYGFVVPQYSIEIRDGQNTRTLRVGATSALGDRVFLQAGGSEVVYAIKADLLKHMPADKNAWRDTELVRLDELPFDAVKVRSGAKTFELKRSQGLWKLSAPLQARADTPKIENLLAQIGSLRVTNFVSDDTSADLTPYGLQVSAQTPPLELMFLQNTNSLLVLQMGGSPTNSANLVYVRRHTPANIMTVQKEPLAQWQTTYTNFLDRHLISCPADQVESIEVKARNGDGEEKFALRRSEGAWMVQPSTGEPFPADPGLMGFFVDTLTNAQTELEQTVAVAFDNYGLAKPALVYSLYGAPSAGRSNLIAQIEFGTNQEGRVFEHRTDETSVNSIQPGYYGRLPRLSWQLRNLRIWNFESNDVVSVTVHQMGSTRKMIRDPNHEWTFAPGSHGMFNPFSLEETLHRLGELTAIYWDGFGDENLDRYGFSEANHSVELEVKRASGIEKLKIEFGKRSQYLHTYASVVLQGKRWIFEFPAPLFNGGVQADLTIAPALRESHRDLQR